MGDSLRGRVAIITGASAGIGRACAEQLAERGMTVLIAARRRDRLETVARGITDRGGRALAHPTDVSVEDEVAGLLDRCLLELGRLDVLICNAGIGYAQRLEATPAAVMRQLMDVNYMGTFFAAQRAIPIFRQQKSGHLIIVSSIVGRRGVGGMAAYSASKFAQTGLGESLRSELRGSGAHVTTVFPVSTRTEFFDAMGRTFGQQVGRYGPQQTAERVAREIAGAVARPRPEVYPLRAARTLAVISALAPRVSDWVIGRFRDRRVR